MSPIKEIGGIYKVNDQWVMEYPDPVGSTIHKTLRAAMEAARKSNLIPRRWYNCDAEVVA